MARVICPACRVSLDLDRHIEAGEFFNCFRCDADLELISLHPLIVDWADGGAEMVGVTRHWSNKAGSAKRSKRDKKKGTNARISEYEEFDYFD